VTCSLFPVPCSHKTPLREHVFRVPCSLSPYGKTHPWYSQVSESLSTVDIDRDRSTGRLKSNRPIDDTCANLILRFPIPPGKAFFRWTWDCILLPKNWVSWISQISGEILNLVNRVLTKNEGPHPKKIAQKSRNSCKVNSGGVGAHGQLTMSSNGLSPETNTNAQRIFWVLRLLRSLWYFLVTNCWSFPHSF